MSIARLLATVLLSLLFASSAGAQDASGFAGTWVFDETSGDREAAKQACAAAAEEYNVLIRSIVRGKLEETVVISEELEMSPGPNTMTISSDLASWTSDLSGTEVAVVDNAGKTVRLRRWIEEGKLHAVGEGGPGKKSFVFELSEDGTRFRMKVTTEGGRLKSPLVYHLTYRKK